MTTLKQLQAMGGFVPDAPVKKDITFPTEGGDVTATIHVRKLGIGHYEDLFLKDKDERSRTARAISEAITLGETGKERITFEQAYSLVPHIAREMLNAFNEVNTPKKSSAPATDS